MKVKIAIFFLIVLTILSLYALSKNTQSINGSENTTINGDHNKVINANHLYQGLTQLTEQIIPTSYIPELLTGYEKFIGRNQELKQIEHNFTKSNVVVISGKAGVGKSSCAIEYGKRQRNSKIIRYFNADSTDKINHKYQELAQELGINIEQQSSGLIMQLVNNRLSKLDAKILFIVPFFRF